MSAAVLAPTGWTRARTVINWINLSTPLGLLIAWLGGATVVRRGRGTWLAGDYRYRFPVAGAFTIGSVIVSRHDAAWLRARPALLRHEDRHCTQYALLLGPVMLPLYVLAVAVSYLLAGDPATRNPFERWAGLADGGYRLASKHSS
ncbi:hypothetical protein [Aeromicrobium sp. CF3.5]|uniref:hypothetical protein n=1 Tax=Aeromicrobium sp. CF3.5 TaxID=3373078 RepID=UPI003EE583C6